MTPTIVQNPNMVMEIAKLNVSNTSPTHHRWLGAVLGVEGALCDENVALHGGESLLFIHLTAAAA